MSGEQARFRRADAIFDAALDLDTGERVAFVTRACGSDELLRTDVLRLLRAHERGDAFLAASAGRIAAPLLDAAAAPAERTARVQRALGDGYRVEARIARGGMAEIYRAHDLKHDRPVAVKVLDGVFGGGIDTDSGMQRFLAEIRVTARLHHPNVLPLFDSGAADGLLYYVMPYVEGETLRQRLQRDAPLPVDEALHLARAIASALEYAHAEGIVHRDLKPENVLLRAGQPIVADFGIALAASRAGEAVRTREGVSLGTPAYMAPEQVHGTSPVDARADVYALGAVLYEMLTGEVPHAASTPDAVLNKKLAGPAVPVAVLREAVPPHVARAVDRALARVPADRFPTVRAFADALVDDAAPPVPARGGHRRRIAGIAVASIIVAAGTIVLTQLPPREAAPARATRFTIAPVPDAAIGRSPSLTPDGRMLVYPGAAGTGRRLFVRAVDEAAARPVAGTEGTLSAFVSPDGRRIGFFTADDRLKVVSIDGGRVRELAGVFRYASGSWAGAERIVISPHGLQGLTWLPATGGPPRPLTRLDVQRRESRHSAPLGLADGRTVVFVAERDRNGPVPPDGELAIATIDPAAGQPRAHALLGLRARRPFAMVDDWLLYVAADGAALMAVRLDTEARRVAGAPVVVMEDADGGIESASLAHDGTLLYTRRGSDNAPVHVDDRGTAHPMFQGLRGSFMNPRYSPDGTRLVVQASVAQGTDAWILDVASGAVTRLATGGSAVGPTWTPDGRALVYLSTAGGATALWRVPADGSAPARRIVEGDGMFAADVAPDGRTVVFQRQHGAAWAIWAAPLDGGGAPRAVVVERFDAFMPALSPDGRWLAYAANPSGRYEIFVRPYPGPGAAIQVSDSGGTEPAWSRDGSRLFFRGDRRMRVASIRTQPTLAIGARRTLFVDAFDGDMPMPHRNYDVAPDGRGFVMIGAAPHAGLETIVVLDWLAELEERLGR